MAEDSRARPRLTLARAYAWLKRRLIGPRAYLPETWTREERIAHLERVVEYLSWQSSRQAVVIRHLLAPVVADLPAVARTRGSFDFQWAELPSGASMLDNPAFRAAAPGNVSRFTGLPASWFAGKSVIDVGCGMGRYSWALCSLGANVLSLDQSDAGLRQTAAACAAFPSHRVGRIDLLRPIDRPERADLVWSFGVLHHTGDSRGAFMRIAPLVKPGGHLYVMIYGEPRPLFDADFAEINEYERWRARTQNLSYAETAAAIRQSMASGEFDVTGDEHVHGYFDAIAPPINDLHSFEEVESWYLDAGFLDTRRTVEARNHHVIGRRPLS